MRFRSIGLLSFGHMITDINQGAIPALLPFFITEYGLTYMEAAGIVFAANITGSIIQPMFGYLSDRWTNSWLMPLGIALAGIGLGLCGWVKSYYLILALVIISGIGVSAFHPTAAKLSNQLAENSKAMGISLFAIGGNGGFAFGPLIATFSVLLLGSKGTILFTLLGVLTALVVYFVFKDISSKSNMTKLKDNVAPEQHDQWGLFSRLSGIVVARSIIFFGLNTFIPLYWIGILKESPVFGSSALTLLFTVGMIGTLMGGKLSDKFGYRNIILWGWVALLPLIFLFTYIQNTVWATVVLVPLSLVLFTIYSPMLVTGQSYLPNHMGFASGVTIGLAVTIGGVIAPILGRIADVSGITAALESLIIIPFFAIILALSLPSNKTQKTKQLFVSTSK